MRSFSKFFLLALFSMALKVQAAIPPYCFNGNYERSASFFADFPVCIGSKPKYCSQGDGISPASSFANTLACIGSNPSYCTQGDYNNSAGKFANSFACIGSKPTYCTQGDHNNSAASYANTLACIASKPTYCTQGDYNNDASRFTNALACLGSNPSYCHSGDYNNSASKFSQGLACAGSKPSYCKNGDYSNSAATFGDSAACMGSQPNYCLSGDFYNSATVYANKVACLPLDFSNLQIQSYALAQFLLTDGKGLITLPDKIRKASKTLVLSLLGQLEDQPYVTPIVLAAIAGSSQEAEVLLQAAIYMNSAPRITGVVSQGVSNDQIVMQIWGANLDPLQFRFDCLNSPEGSARLMTTPNRNQLNFVVAARDPACFFNPIGKNVK